MALFNDCLVLIRGGGDLASGVICRLHRAGFPVMVTELEKPLFVRRKVAYGDAVYSGQISIEGITARLVDFDDVHFALESGEIPVVVDADGKSIATFKPTVIVDARMAKINLGTTLYDAPCVIGLGPGFTANHDCHVVIETNRGHDLGRAIYRGCAEPNTGVPGTIQGMSHTRVLRAPIDGRVEPLAQIGATIQVEQTIATIQGQTIIAPFAGVLRGLIHSSVIVTKNMKIGDLDPRAIQEHCFTISDKAFAIGGGVLEATMASVPVRSVFFRVTDENPSGI